MVKPGTRDRRLTIFLIASFITNIGGWMQAGAVPYITYQLTQSPLWVGVVTLCGFLPTTLATIPGGFLADHFDRGRVLAWTQFVAGISSVAAWALIALLGLSMPVLLAYLVVQSALLGLSVASFQTAIDQYAGEQSLAEAVNVNSAQAQLAKAAGPAIAGIALAHYSGAFVFFVNGLTFLAAALAFAKLRGNGGAREISAVSRHFKEMFRLTMQHPARRALCLFGAAFFVLATPVYSMIAVVVDSVLQQGAAVYGLLVGMYGAGCIAGNLVVASGRFTRRRQMTLAVGSVAASLLAIAISTSTVVTGVAIFVAGAGNLMGAVTLMTSLQLLTPRQLRGRTVAIYSFLTFGATAAGGLITGGLARVTSVETGLAIAGGGLALLMVTMVLRPELQPAIDAERLFDVDLAESRAEPEARLSL